MLCQLMCRGLSLQELARLCIMTAHTLFGCMAEQTQMCSDDLDFSTRAFARNLCESITRWLTAAQDFPRCTDPSYRGRVETGGNLRQGHS